MKIKLPFSHFRLVFQEKIKKMNRQAMIVFILISVLLNVLFIGFKIRDYFGSKLKQASIPLINIQPIKVSYHLFRNKMFEKLPNDSDEIIMLGNSLTQNFEWHELFKDLNIKNRGIESDITKGVLLRLNEIIESHPKKIFIEIGINDLLYSYSIESIFQNYKKIVETIQQKSPNTQIYLQNILPTSRETYQSNKSISNDIIDLNKKLKLLCDSKYLIYIDLYSKFEIKRKLNKKYDCGDNLHLNGEGYILWCKLISSYVYE